MTSRSDEAPAVPYPTEDELRRSAPVEGTVVYVPSAHNNCATETPVTVTADGGVTLPSGRCPGCGYAFTPAEVVALEQAALAEVRRLAGRVAHCTYCGARAARPSLSEALAFFEYRGEGSQAATDQCATCGCVAAAHAPRKLPFASLNGITDHPFVAHGPWETDLYYCGCRGWE